MHQRIDSDIAMIVIRLLFDLVVGVMGVTGGTYILLYLVFPRADTVRRGWGTLTEVLCRGGWTGGSRVPSGRFIVEARRVGRARRPGIDHSGTCRAIIVRRRGAGRGVDGGAERHHATAYCGHGDRTRQEPHRRGQTAERASSADLRSGADGNRPPSNPCELGMAPAHGGPHRVAATIAVARRCARSSCSCGYASKAVAASLAIALLAVGFSTLRIGEAANPGPNADEGVDDGGLSLVWGNGTGWGTILNWAKSCKYHIMCVQEHRQLLGEDVAAASQQAIGARWKSFWCHAIPSQHDAADPSGGTAVLVKCGIGARDPPGGPIVVEGHVSAALVEAGGVGGIVVYSLYLRCGDELGPYNWDVLRKLAMHIASHGLPWAVCGDWNVPPEVLAASGWADRVHGRIVAPPVSHTTTVAGRPGRLIDYAVVCRRIAELGISTHVDGTATLRTHSAIGLRLPVRPRSFEVTVLKAARRFPQQKPIGPRKAPRTCDLVLATAREATRLAETGNVEEATAARDKAVKQWLGHVEEELILEYHLDESPHDVSAYRGRADGPKFVREPIMGPQRSHGHPAAGAETRRLRLLQDRAYELAAALGRAAGARGDKEILERAKAAIDAAHHAGSSALGDASSANLAGLLKGTARAIERIIRGRTAAEGDGAGGPMAWHRSAATDIANRARAAADDRTAENAKEIRDSISEWCRSAEANGASKAHKWTQVPQAWRPETARDIGAPVDCVTSNPDALVMSERVKWAPIWAPPGAPQAQPRWGTVPRLPRPTVREVRQAARRFKRATGQSADRVSPRDLADLGDDVLEVVIELMCCSELLGTVPQPIALIIVLLIAKKDGGRRPIGLLPALYRLWTRVRQPYVREWESQWDRKYFAAARGKSTTDVAWLRALRAEYATSVGATAASTLWDLHKCFEHGGHALWADEAKEVYFPLAIARMAVSMYTAERRLMLDGAYAQPVIPTRGYVAGCTNALAAIKATMIRRLDALVARNPDADVDMFVDDVELQTIGSKSAVVIAQTKAVHDLADAFERQLGYPLAADKAVVIANDDVTAAAIVEATGGKAGTAVKVTSKLGVEFTCGRKRPARGGPRRLRYRRQLGRRRRLGKLKRIGCSVSQVIRRGLTPAATFGGVVHGVSDHELNMLELLSSNATAPNTRGTSRTLKLLLGHHPAVEANAGVMIQWASAIWRACGPRGNRRRTDPTPNLMEAAIKKAERLLRDQGMAWSAVAGPAGAAILTARRMGWEFLSGFRLRDERGEQIDMGCTDPRGVRAAAERATRAKAAASAASRMGMGDASSGIWVAPIRRALGTSAMTPMAKACLKRVFSGGFWTNARRAAEGLCLDNVCELCRRGVDDLYHRIWECKHCADLRRRYTTEQMRERAAAAARDDPLWTRAIRLDPWRDIPPPRRDHSEQWYFAEGIAEDRSFAGAVFTDGSALNPQCPEARRAGWAVIQLGPGGKLLKAVFGHVPASASFEQTAAAGEVYALRRAAELSTGDIAVHVDYQGIIDGCRNGQSWCTSPRRPNAASWKGFWRAMDDRQPHVVKVKAHRTKQEAMNDDDDADAVWKWHGNRTADYYAKIGARSHATAATRAKADVYEKQLADCASLARWIGIALSQWPRASTGARAGKARRATGAARRIARRNDAATRYGHQLSWSRDGWRCRTCGKGAATAVGARTLARSRCEGHTANRIGAQGLAPTAHTLWAAEADNTQTGRLAPDVVWCSRCGAYSSTKVYNLGKACAGVPEKSARTRLAAFNCRTHPVTRHALAPPVRLTDDVLSALAGGAARRRAAFNNLLRGDPLADVRPHEDHDHGREHPTLPASTSSCAEPEETQRPSAAESLPPPKRVRRVAPDGTAPTGIEDMAVMAIGTGVGGADYESEEDVFAHGFSLDNGQEQAEDRLRVAKRPQDHDELAALSAQSAPGLVFGPVPGSRQGCASDSHQGDAGGNLSGGKRRKIASAPSLANDDTSLETAIRGGPPSCLAHGECKHEHVPVGPRDAGCAAMLFSRSSSVCSQPSWEQAESASDAVDRTDGARDRHHPRGLASGCHECIAEAGSREGFTAHPAVHDYRTRARSASPMCDGLRGQASTVVCHANGSSGECPTAAPEAGVIHTPQRTSFPAEAREFKRRRIRGKQKGTASAVMAALPHTSGNTCSSTVDQSESSRCAPGGSVV